MCVHCDKKQIHAVDELLDVITNGPDVSKRIASTSTVKSWNNEPPQTPYQDYKKLLKRVKTNTKLVSKVFKIWKDRFNENYAAATGSIFLFQKKELTIEAWEQMVILGVASTEEMYSVLISIAEDELLTTASEVRQALFKLKSVISETVNEPPPNVMRFLEQYEFRLSESTASQVDQRLKNIVVNGVANGDSSPDIAKQIRKTFDTLSSSKAEAIARTETIRASAEGAKVAYTKAGIQQVALLPALTACPLCMDVASNNPYDVNDMSATPPLHPNCKCCLIPVFDETDVIAISTGVVDQDSF